MGQTTSGSKTHGEHTHSHGPNCGHRSIRHDSHTDYLHDGHLHCVQGGKVHEHTIEVTSKNPANCTTSHDCTENPKDHRHGSTCGHDSVPHGDHTDYLVKGHLHYPHGTHCDDHGEVQLVD